MGSCESIYVVLDFVKCFGRKMASILAKFNGETSATKFHEDRKIITLGVGEFYFNNHYKIWLKIFALNSAEV